MRGRMIVRMLAVVGGLVAAAPATGADGTPTPTPQWRIQRSPLPDYGDSSWQDGEFEAVSCPNTSFCIALGSGTYQAPESLGGWWNGKSWYLDGTAISGLEDNQGISSPALSCVSAKKCFAVVDASSINTQIAGYATWNGHNWSETNDLPGEQQGDGLNAISCPSARFCMAAGWIGNNDLFALAYNGHKWRKALVAKSPAGALNGVSCPAANACFAVGPSPGGGQLGVIERWNGRVWRAQRAPIDPRARRIGLNDVSCSAQNACVAVGVYTDPAGHGRVFALSWDGRSWHRMSFGNSNGTLISVSCVASGSCVAVGSLSRRPVARMWNGTSWNLVALPDPGYAGLSSVSCATATYCMAVGTMPGGVAPVAISYF